MIDRIRLELARKTGKSGEIDMTPLVLMLAIAFSNPLVPIEKDHAGNEIYAGLIRDGFDLADVKVVFPPSLLNDEHKPDAEAALLRTLTGSDRGVTEFIRDSVTAPQILKIRDLSAGDKGIVRVADLWFVIRANLDAIDLNNVSGSDDGKPIEAGNMRFGVALLGEKELKTRGIGLKILERPVKEWYLHATGRLLDRIEVEATDRIVASKSDASWVIAAITDPKFDADPAFPNRWNPVGKATEQYAGGASYVKIAKLTTVSGALLVEAHFAFFEPRQWFDGAPILRSKLALIAQDRVRSLRRELKLSQPAAKPRTPQD